MSGNHFHNENKTYVSVTNIFNSVMERLGLQRNDEQTSFMSEINDFGEYSTVEEIEGSAYKAIYGLISGDEGWRFMPDDLVRQRLESKWGSRDFARVYSFGSGSVLINLDSSRQYEDYIRHQQEFGSTFYGGMNPYFSLKSNIAGVAHGVLFSVETVMAIKTIVNRVYAQQEAFNSGEDRQFNKHLHKSREFRQKLLATLHLVENIGISEMGELENMMLRSQSIEPVIEKLKYLLDLQEDELNLLYSERTNRLVNLLTIIGLALTLIGTAASLLQIIFT